MTRFSFFSSVLVSVKSGMASAKPARVYSLFGASFLAASILLPSFALASEAWVPENPVLHLKKVQWTQGEESAVLRIFADQPPTFAATARGQEVVLDVMNAKVDFKSLQLQSPWVKKIVVEELKQGKKEFSRMHISLKKSVVYDVIAKGNSVYLTLKPRILMRKNAPLASLAEIQTRAPSQQKVARLQNRKANLASDVRLAQAEPVEEEAQTEEGSAGASTDDGSETSSANRMTYIGFRNTSTGSTLFARMNHKNVVYEVKREGQNLLVLEISDASIPLRNNKNYLDTTHFNSPVKMITPTEVDDETSNIRIVIELKEDVPYQDLRDGVDIVINFKK